MHKVYIKDHGKNIVLYLDKGLGYIFENNSIKLADNNILKYFDIFKLSKNNKILPHDYI